MLIDRNSGVHLYIQIADSIRRTITSGGFPVGSALPTEEDLCRLYGVSRYPMRQAMDILVKEGYLRRVRGKGTFVTSPEGKEGDITGAAHRKLLALVLPALAGEFVFDILRGFEKAAGGAGYAMLLSVSPSTEAEPDRIEAAIGLGVSGVAVFPHPKSKLAAEWVAGWAGRGVLFSLIGGNPGLDNVDYVGCDDRGGGYMAAYHMHRQGFANAVLLSDDRQDASVEERLGGFRNGIDQFGMRLLNAEAAEGGPPDPAACSAAGFAERLGLYRKHLPFAVFASSDGTAAKAMEALREKGIEVGREAGVIGYGNSAVCEHIQPGLTSVTQNGLLIGQAAAKLAVEKIASRSKQVVRHILPAQLVARSSCGEGKKV